ncbi:hypothetical protein CY34DRAFT_798581 [Suillus luteus UH-Slu-Lm8-n1]|uniref:Secreted protein n=1 Tax=Suillus luteus UH-Slu-Lm8-n1 TaxID=930992 RepID=A0A0D0BEG7_9AGAM|nr:hypothetical protein CY34DRAFT_798581 [Suillus luteus UH-Slu-Lm8-n1]
MYFIDGLTLILALVTLRRAQANFHHPYHMLTSKFRGTNLSEGNHVYQAQMTYGIKRRHDAVRNNHKLCKAHHAEVCFVPAMPAV